LQERLGLAEDVGAVLLLIGVTGRHGVTSPVDPDAHAVIIDRLLKARQGAGRHGRALQGGDEGNIHLLAALLGVVQRADDGVDAVAHVGREHVFANELADDFLPVLNKLVVRLGGGDGHWNVLSNAPKAARSGLWNYRRKADFRSPASLSSSSSECVPARVALLSEG